jgi:hypothetical protein
MAFPLRYVLDDSVPPLCLGIDNLLVLRHARIQQCTVQLSGRIKKAVHTILCP